MNELRVALVGTGALGSHLCHLLAEAGVQNVLLIDPDTVQPRNLSASPLLQEACISHPARGNKALLIADHVHRHYHLAWQALPVAIADVGLGRFADVNVLCTCTDSALSRVEAAWTAYQLHLPHLDCGVFGDGIEQGRVAFFHPAPEKACYLCGVREERRAAMLAYAASASLGCVPPPSEAAMTGTASTVQTVAAHALQLLAHLSGMQGGPSFADRLTRSASGGWLAEQTMLPPSQSCPWHEPLLKRQRLAMEIPLQHLLGDRVLQLDWPVCTDCVCEMCGGRSRPMRRLAIVRQVLLCAVCGAKGMLNPLHCVETIDRRDPLATLTLRQLGQPEQHLYLLRDRFQPITAEGNAHG